MSKASDALRSIAGYTDTGAKTSLPSIPNAPRTEDANLNQFLSAVKQTVETWAGNRGDELDASVTWRGLIEKNFAAVDNTNGKPVVSPAWSSPVGARGKSALGYDTVAIPPAPTNLRASGAFANIILTWNTPPYANHSYTEIWRSGTNNLGTAELVGMAAGAVYADNVGGAHKYYYWVRFVSTSAIKGPYNGTQGTFGETAVDPGFLLETLTGQLQSSQLNKDLSAKIELAGTAAADIISINDIKIDSNSAAARAIAQVQARLDTGDYAAVKTESSATASAVDGVKAQYTVKVDVNGYVSGFGLASTATDSTPYSQFIFKADQFGFGAPGLNSAYPFVIQATSTTINGVEVPAGVYIDAAYIKNGTISSAKIADAAIDDAKIANLSAAKITAGDISTGVLTANVLKAANFSTDFLDAARIDTRGLSIKDEAGNVILSSGTALDWSKIGGTKKPADNATKNQVFKQDAQPSGGTYATGDFWIKTSTPQAIYTYTTGTGWVKNADMTIDNVAAAVVGQGNFATLSKITASNIGTYIDVAAIGSAYIGNLDAGKITTGSLSASRISGGTMAGVSLNIADSSGNWILQANYFGSGGCSMWRPYFEMAQAGNLGNPTQPALKASSVAGSEGIVGNGSATWSSTCHGVRGTQAVGTSGIVGVQNGYDFYADGTGVNYGPFTGSHDALVALDETLELGEIVVDVECLHRRGVSNTLCHVTKSSIPNQKGCVGVVAKINGHMDLTYMPAVFDQNNIMMDDFGNGFNEHTAIYNELKDNYNYILMNALGEGQVYVCGENGDLEPGDLITTSSMPGKGMKQSDDLVRSHTVAKCREPVTFSSPDEVKMVACIYLCG